MRGANLEEFNASVLVNAIHRLNFERKRGLSMQLFKIKVEDCSIARLDPIH